jgi:hypothetical protein
MYPNVSNYHMKSAMELKPADGQQQTEENTGRQAHQLSSGPFELRSGYGISTAEQCGFPKPVVAEARRLLPAVMQACPVAVHATTVDRSVFATNELLQQLLLLEHAHLDDAAFCSYLYNLRRSVSVTDATQMLLYLKSVLMERESRSIIETDATPIAVTGRSLITAAPVSFSGCSLSASVTGSTVNDRECSQGSKVAEEKVSFYTCQDQNSGEFEVAFDDSNKENIARNGQVNIMRTTESPWRPMSSGRYDSSPNVYDNMPGAFFCAPDEFDEDDVVSQPVATKKPRIP